MGRWTRFAAAATVPLLLLVASGLAACGKSGTGGNTATQPPPSVWPLPGDPEAAAQKAGLSMLDREMLAVHYHAHLDVLVRGVHVTVPAFIGIDTKQPAITALHTHDPTGIVHIESAEDIPFTLGQFFTEWGQPLSPTQVGPVKVAEGEIVRVYRNGQHMAGGPAAMRFTAHAEIVVWLGPASEQPRVPSAYSFPPNL
jgi:hypothetical protein